MDLQRNADRFSGTDYVALYDRYRPIAPAEVFKWSLRYLEHSPAHSVLDLGCGTGLSTHPWCAHAQRVIGLEPSASMLEIAARNYANQTPSIEWLEAFAHDIPLEDASIDICASSQSFHWMEPQSTLQEVNRVLAPGGIFLIYDRDWPPSFDWQLELAYRELFARVREISDRLEEPLAHRWSKQEHAQRVRESGAFRMVKEVVFHREMKGGIDAFRGLALSQGGIEALLKRGKSAEEIGLEQFEIALKARADQVEDTYLLHYRAMIAKK